MAISLAQIQALNKLAKHLYPYLPGKAHPFANQEVSFEGVAASLSLGAYWPGGSKLPAISQLLTNTLQHKPEKFCPLTIQIVQRGMTYRQNKDIAFTRDEIEDLNKLVAEVGFKIPELWDPKFLDTLPKTPDVPPSVESPSLSEDVLGSLKRDLVEMAALEPQARGFRFEKFLSEVFQTFDLAPRSAFRQTGEQIDGSMQFQDDTYLIEAKWCNDQLGQKELLVFSGKVAGKAQWSRGLLISYSGFTPEGLEAFARGKSTNVIGMDGFDFHCVLEGRLDLHRVLARKARRAAETNEAHVSVRDLFPEAF